MKLVRYSLLLLSVVASVYSVTSSESATGGNGNEEKFSFQAEVSRMMDIIIHSLYQHREVFLRELISNSADALDKLRFLSLQNPDLIPPTASAAAKELDIHISSDKEKRILVIRDSGIGMTREELISNLGTVAKSGTANFIEQFQANAKENGGAGQNLIGQFGVGFYSVYLVADRVVVRSKSAMESDGDVINVWESSADSTFTVRTETGEFRRGTEITLHLKEEADEFLDEVRLENLVKRYSEFISFPIYLRKTIPKSPAKPVEAPEEEDDDDEIDDGEDEEEEEEADVEDEPEEEEGENWQLLNEQKAIWTRAPSEITDEEYKGFYGVISKSGGSDKGPLTWTHFKAEGDVEFSAILFVPKTAPYGLYDNYYSAKSKLKLYVRKVLIKDDFAAGSGSEMDLIPKYLNFVVGVVDSESLPLSVSRETLQQSKAVKVISKKLTRKILDMIKSLADEAEKSAESDSVDESDDEASESTGTKNKYAVFYSQYAKSLKLGVIEDSPNRNKLVKLLRFKTTKTEPRDTFASSSKAEDWISLETYKARMKPSQKHIYYLSGEDLETIKASPFLKHKAIVNGEIEVLLLDDALDEYMFNANTVSEYEGLKFRSLSSDGVTLEDATDIDKKEAEMERKKFKKVYKELTKWLHDKVYNENDTRTAEKVTVAPGSIPERVPAVIKSAQTGQSARMQKIMKAQALADNNRFMPSSKILELNPRSPLINKLRLLYEESVNNNDKKTENMARELAWGIYDSALVSSGFEIEKPQEFVQRMYAMMQNGYKVKSLEPLETNEIEGFDDVEEETPEAEPEEVEPKEEL